MQLWSLSDPHLSHYTKVYKQHLEMQDFYNISNKNSDKKLN